MAATHCPVDGLKLSTLLSLVPVPPATHPHAYLTTFYRLASTHTHAYFYYKSNTYSCTSHSVTFKGNAVVFLMVKLYYYLVTPLCGAATPILMDPMASEACFMSRTNP